MENAFEASEPAKKRLRRRHGLYFYSALVIPGLNTGWSSSSMEGRGLQTQAEHTSKETVQAAGKYVCQDKQLLVWGFADRSLV